MADAPKLDLKVVGAGFGRTGTMSLKHALNVLNFGPTYHMEDNFARDDSAAWLRAWRRPDLPPAQRFAHLAGFGAAVDLPASAFAADLAAACPSAKVVLTVRDFDAWYESCAATIFRVGAPGGGVAGWLSALPFFVVPKLRRFRAMVDGVIFGESGVTGGPLADRAAARAFWDRWIADKKAAIPAGRLLVFDVREGWGPLCGFLGVPVPDVPFPRVNDRAAFQATTARLRRRRLAAAARWGAAALAVAAAVALARRR